MDLLFWEEIRKVKLQRQQKSSSGGKASKKQKKQQVDPRRFIKEKRKEKIQIVMKAPTGSQEHTPIKRDQIYDIPTGLWLKKCIPCSAAIFKPE